MELWAMARIVGVRHLRPCWLLIVRVLYATVHCIMSRPHGPRPHAAIYCSATWDPAASAHASRLNIDEPGSSGSRLDFQRLSRLSKPVGLHVGLLVRSFCVFLYA